MEFRRRMTTVDVTILICTYNRATYLADTLDGVARLRTPDDLSWEVLVVDNNSADTTKAVVHERQASYPVPLRYAFEGRQGKSVALNTGAELAAGRIIAYTDDDVRVPHGWLEAAVRPLIERRDIAYTGGPVRPIWEAPPPVWLDPSGNLGGTIAVKDHGGRPFVFEDRRRTPLGVNMAVRRDLVLALGGFRPDLGRRGKSLLGQEQAEFFYRTRAAGAIGLYVPEMVLDHHVPAARLTHNYFRRWWFWKGISQARLHRIHRRTELGLDLTTVRRIFDVPAFMLRGIVADAFGALRAALARRWSAAAEREMMMWYGVGYAVERIRGKWRGLQASGPEPSPSPQRTSNVVISGR
jgi:glycosyltransferase involved in cell wall biosynthesis